MRERNYSYSILVADFETTHHKEYTEEEILLENRDSFAKEGKGVNFTPNDTSKMFLAGLQSTSTGEYRLSYENMVDFFNNVSNIAYKEHHQKAEVYFHNLAYDGSYILNWLLQHGYKQTLKTNKWGRPWIGKKEFSALISNGKFFNITLVWRGITIIFLDSLKLLPSSLAKLGKELLNMEKLKDTVNYTEFEIFENHNYPQEWITYLQRDVNILNGCIKQLYQHEKHITLKRQTIGSISYSYVKKIVEELTPKFTIADYKLWELWYHGGLCFPSFNAWAKWVKGDIGVYDIVSSYPTAMTKKLPYGEALKDIPQGDYVAFYKIHINEAHIKKQYKSIACMWKPFEIIDGVKYVQESSKYQYLQHLENADYYITDIELNMFKELYDIDYKVLDVWYFKASNYLAGTIKEMFKEKDEAKKKHQPTKKLLAKLKLNNIYGKMGQKPNRPQAFYGDKESIDQTVYEIVSEKTGLLKGYNIRKIKQETDKARPIFIAAYITSLARVKLLSKIKEGIDLGMEFLYCDTDSCFFKKNGKEISEIGEELGMWENEANGKYFCSLCPKQYRLVDQNGKVVKLASAGVSKQLMIDVANEDYNYDLGDNPKYKLVKQQLKDDVSGKVIWDSPFNFCKYKTKPFNLKNPKCPKELKNANK